ncbi:MAG: CRISPR-associated RAMP protein [Gemmatales bacterium]|nr:MAG: CRISPR-associated RAMP protein [Gemmatales bacterium]GIW97858.1 MAG: CRISPR-associated RAMP protein [Pirellulaceae bacterium]
MTSAINWHTKLQRKLQIQFSLHFDTAWRIGSGKEGETLSDLGVVLDPSGQPVLPGSSLKGRLRSTCETLAHALGLSACMLDSAVSNCECSSDVQYYRRVREDYRKASQAGVAERLEWIEKHTCDVCKLYGSPVMAGRLRISDGTIEDWAEVIQVRDGVVIDRDSQTAVDGLKYDYEVVPPGSRFRVTIDVENYSDADLALLGAAIFEWSSGSTVGGFTSRGLGRFHLEDVCIRGVDLSDPNQRIQFLTNRTAEDRLTDLGNWEEFFSSKIESAVSTQST